jgi:predicted Zn-dependent peptidase
VEEFLEKIDQVTAEDVQNVAQELFQKNRYNLQIIGPFKDEDKFAKLLT